MNETINKSSPKTTSASATSGVVADCRRGPEANQGVGRPGPGGCNVDAGFRSTVLPPVINDGKLESIGTLAGGIAHNYNNILQAISGYTQLLLMDKPVDHPDFDILHRIEKALVRADWLTRQLLAFSGRFESDYQPLDLNSTVNRVRQRLEPENQKNLRIQLALTPALGKVNADAVQMEQVLFNLGVNALQSMRSDGTLTFMTETVVVDGSFGEATDCLLPGRYVRLTVNDTGTGMEPATLERVFDPFFTTREVGEGPGLGLSVAYGIVKNHGGRIMCRSTPTQGTTVHIYLPSI